jgi:phage gpG-like protein
MSEEAPIQLTPEAEKILQDLREMPGWMMDAIARGMDKANVATVSHIQLARLSGQGPFAIAEHRLGVRSQLLRTELWASKTTVSGNEAQSAIGDPVKYAAIHEFGGAIHHKARRGAVRLRVNAHGELIRQAAHPHLAVFAKGEHKRAKEVAYEAGEHDVIMPERAPVRTGIRESLQQYGATVSAEIQAAWDGMKGGT